MRHRHEKLYRIAKKIDNFRESNNLSKNNILKLLEPFNPKYLGHGKYKRSFKVESTKKVIAFKVGKNLQEDYDYFSLI